MIRTLTTSERLGHGLVRLLVELAIFEHRILWGSCNGAASLFATVGRLACASGAPELACVLLRQRNAMARLGRRANALCEKRFGAIERGLSK